ncbi:MAG TPA: hypothetical protein VLZ05_17290 [Mycobacterium sp.]|nr:hypothetical protein [Mycobacterium sp.]HUH70452.1 hypothetical protein [Mycobacterium sp.]
MEPQPSRIGTTLSPVVVMGVSGSGKSTVVAVSWTLYFRRHIRRRRRDRVITGDACDDES